MDGPKRTLESELKCIQLDLLNTQESCSQTFETVLGQVEEELKKLSSTSWALTQTQMAQTSVDTITAASSRLKGKNILQQMHLSTGRFA
jgi:hypothetical protein